MKSHQHIPFLISLRIAALITSLCGCFYLLIRFIELSTIQAGFSQVLDFTLPFQFWPALLKAAVPLIIGIFVYFTSNQIVALSFIAITTDTNNDSNKPLTVPPKPPMSPEDY